MQYCVQISHANKLFIPVVGIMLLIHPAHAILLMDSPIFFPLLGVCPRVYVPVRGSRECIVKG